MKNLLIILLCLLSVTVFAQLPKGSPFKLKGNANAHKSITPKNTVDSIYFPPARYGHFSKVALAHKFKNYNTKTDSLVAHKNGYVLKLTRKKPLK